MNKNICVEEWKPVPGLSYMMVSNYGRVKSLDRTIRQKNKYGKYNDRKLKGKMLTPFDNGHGYKMIHIRENGKRTVRYVHRLVAEAFIDNPENKPHVNHIDYDRSNNHFENLEWCTAKENARYSAWKQKGKRKNTSYSATGERYIYYRAKHKKYRVVIDKHEYPGVDTLEEAIRIRDSVLEKEVV